MSKKFTNVIIKYVNRMTGCALRSREIHWRNKDGNLHTASETLDWTLRDICDSIVEQFAALNDREDLPDGFYQPEIILGDFENVVDVVKKNSVKFIKLIEKYDTDGSYVGVKTKLEDLIGNTLVNLYRSELE